MRVLVVDQDSASNLAITRSLRDLYTVDCVTNKADCLGLLRSNTFEVIVATERLEDGSGLELLGQISKKWPSVLRIFAAERQRLQLLRGRLGPFELFQTLVYPIDPDKLLATLEMAVAAQSGATQEVELTSDGTAASDESADAPEAPAEAPSEAPFEMSALDRPLDLEQSGEFSEPRFARLGRAEALHTASSGRGMPVVSRVGSGQRVESGSGVGPGAGVGPGPRVGSRFGSGSVTGSGSGASRGSGGAPRALAVESGDDENDLAAKFPGSGTIGPRRAAGGSGGFSYGGSPGGASGRASRSGSERSTASKAPPVRFPPLERTPPLKRTPPLERVPPLEAPPARSAGGDFSEAAAMARAARSNYESSTDELDTKRLATLIGGGVAVVAVVVFLGLKMFGSKSEAPRPAAPPVVAHAPDYPPEVTELVAQTEAAFKADDFKAARADVDRLRQLSPSHPRLDFFQGLLSSHAEGGKRAAASSSSSSSKRNGTKGGATSTARPKSDTSAPPVAKGDSGASSAVAGASVATPAGSAGAATGAAAARGSTMATGGSAAAATGATTAAGSSAAAAIGATTAAGGAAAVSGSSAAAGAAAAPAMAAVGATAAPGSTSAATAVAGPLGGASVSPGVATNASVAPSASEGAPTATPAPAAAQATHTPGATAAHRGAGEPPPVVQEAKLIRRVNPDYPSAAKKDGITGSVDLEVTVSPQGVVENVSVIQATPPDTFDRSAVAAVRKWKYDPRFVDGLPSQARLKVHLEFVPTK